MKQKLKRGIGVLSMLLLALAGWVDLSYAQFTLSTIIQLDKQEYCSGDTLVLTILREDNFLPSDSIFFFSFFPLHDSSSQPLLLSELHLSIKDGQFRIPLPDTFSQTTSVEFYLSQSGKSATTTLWKEKSWIHLGPEVMMKPLPSLCLNTAPLVLDQGSPAGGRYWGSGVRDGKFYASELIPALFTINYEVSSERGCKSFVQGEIEILPTPTVTSFPLSDASFCLSDEPLSLKKGKPKGGYLAGLGVGDSTFYPELAGPGKHKISYVVEEWGCTDSLSAYFDVLPRPEFSFPDISPICVGDDTIQLKASPAGGVFEGIGIVGNSFFSRGLSQGSYTIDYRLEHTQCPDQAQFQLELISIDTPPRIENKGDTLWAVTEHTSLQWWHNDQPLMGEVKNYIRPEMEGDYRVNIKGEGGCEAFSEPVEWILTSAIIESRLLSEWSIFPNPAKDYAVVNWRDHFEKNSEIRVYTSSGKLVKRQYLPEDSHVYVLEVGNWEAGIYIAKITMGNFNTQRKIVVKR